MQTQLVIGLLFAVFGMFLEFAGSQAGATPDISGTWSFSVDVGENHGEPTFVFKQEGEKLSGTITNARGDSRVAGTVTGETAVFGWDAVIEGQATQATYRGTIESPTRMTGTVEFTGALNGMGTWTATKK